MSNSTRTAGASRPPQQRAVAGLLAVAVLIAVVVLERLDVALAEMHGEQDRPGGFGAVASPGALFRPDSAAAVLAGWRNWEGPPGTTRSPGELIGAYAVVDLLLLAVPLAVLLVLLARILRERETDGPRSVAVRAMLAASVVASALYLAGDVAETLGTALVWDDDPGTLAIAAIGAASIVKWVALTLVGLALLIAALRRRTLALRAAEAAEAAEAANPAMRAKSPRSAGRAGSRAARPVPTAGRRASVAVPWRHSRLSPWVVLRGQLVVVAGVVAIMVLLSGDIGRQVDDVVVRGVDNGLPAVLAVLAAAVFSAVLAIGGRATLAAYRRAPRAVEWSGRGILVGVLVGAGLLAVGVAVFASGNSVGAPLLAFGGGTLLFFVLNAPAGVRAYALPSQGDVQIGRGALPVIAAVPPGALALAGIRAAVTLWVDGGSIVALLAWSLLLMLLALAAALFVYLRASHPPRPVVRGVLTAWVAAALVLSVLGALFGPDAAVELGTVATIVVSGIVLAVVVTALVLIGDVLPASGALSLLGLRRVPVLAIVLALGVAASFIDRQAAYYDVRLLDSAAAERPSLGDGDGDGDGGAIPPALRQWIDQQPAGDGAAQEIPLVLMASEGGGIRAAYWTSIVWECLYGGGVRIPDAAEGSTDPCPGDLPPESVFLVSSVSGSSVGMAMVRANAMSSADRNGDGDWLPESFAGDYVAPAIAAAVFRDLPNTVLRLPIAGQDRASSLERAFSTRNPGIDDGFAASGVDEDGRARFPLLVFGATSVEDGCRMAVSSAAGVEPSTTQGTDCLTPGQFAGTPENPAARPPDGVLAATKDAFAWSCPRVPDDTGPRDIRLSTAALLSARAPYITPAGGMTSCLDREAHSYVLDGGLLENSGADAVEEVWSDLEPAVRGFNAGAEAAGRCIAPRLLLLDNEFASHGVRDPGGRSFRLIGPAGETSSVTRAQDGTAQQEALIALSRSFGEVRAACPGAAGEDPEGVDARDVTDAAPADIHPRARPGSEAPLGWTLAERSQLVLRAELGSAENRAQLDLVRRWYGD
ncbi:hypothetical protein ACFDTO_10905 [Microbacteriaceae bacterium 4G12]